MARRLRPRRPCCFSGLTPCSPPGSWHSVTTFMHVPGKPATRGPFHCCSQDRLLHVLQVSRCFPQKSLHRSLHLKMTSLCPHIQPFLVYSSSWFYNLSLHVKYFNHTILLSFSPFRTLSRRAGIFVLFTLTSLVS